jgi:hypothetical protein
MKKPKVSTIQTIVLLDVLRYLQEEECKKLGIEYTVWLPDGSKGIFDRCWNLVRDSYRGNQRFCNDSYFVYVFRPDEDRSEDEQKMYEVCAEALTIFTDVTDEQQFEMVVFEVSW